MLVSRIIARIKRLLTRIAVAGGGIIDMMNTRLQNRMTESEILKIFSDVVEVRIDPLDLAVADGDSTGGRTYALSISSSHSPRSQGQNFAALAYSASTHDLGVGREHPALSAEQLQALRFRIDNNTSPPDTDSSSRDSGDGGRYQQDDDSAVSCAGTDGRLE